MNNKEFLAGLAQKWGSSVTDTRKRVDNIVRVMGDCLDEGMPVAVQTLGVFVIMKYKESIVVDNKKRRMLVPPRMELCLFQQEQLPEIQAAEEGELADRLAAVLGEAPEAARAIVESFFHFLADAIDAELLVKVKGLGAFKAISTRETRHIDTDTGETVSQTESSEVSYTPDKAMRDVVNRPFAQFKPIELNEGVVFDDITDNEEPLMMLGANRTAAVSEEPGETEIPTENPAEPAAQQEEQPAEAAAGETVTHEPAEPQHAESVAPEIQLPEEETQTAPNEQVATDGEGEVTQRMAALADNAVSASEEETNEDEAVQASAKRKKWLWVALPAAVLLLALLVLLPRMSKNDSDEQAEAATEVKTDSVPQKAEPDFNAMNKLIPYGAYDIVGIDTTIVVRPGQSLSFICRAYIGPDMESYIQVLNGIENINPGDTIKIPKLQLRSQYQQSSK